MQVAKQKYTFSQNKLAKNGSKAGLQKVGSRNGTNIPKENKGAYEKFGVVKN